jgi:hypothetical protein
MSQLIIRPERIGDVVASAERTRIGVDFTRVRDDGTLSLSIERLKEELGAIPWRDHIVELYEDDGQSCWAVVTEVQAYTVVVKLVWSTYRSEFAQVEPIEGLLMRSISVDALRADAGQVEWKDWTSSRRDVRISQGLTPSESVPG